MNACLLPGRIIGDVFGAGPFVGAVGGKEVVRFYFSTEDHARNNFPFCRPIARHLWLFLIRGILNVEQLRFRFHSIAATKSTIHLAPKFGNLFRARSLVAVCRQLALFLFETNHAAVNQTDKHFALGDRHTVRDGNTVDRVLGELIPVLGGHGPE